MADAYFAEDVEDHPSPEKKPLRWPCVLDGKIVRPCWALAQVAEGGRRKGVRRLDYVKIEDGSFAPARTIFAIASGQHAKEGVSMNFCPFCGAKILPEHDTATAIRTQDDEAAK